MNTLDINACREIVYKQIEQHKLVNVNATMLGAFVFKSKRPALTSLALWNESLMQVKNTFSKLSPEKQQELIKHTVIELPFIFDRKISLHEVLTLSDTSGSASNILGFVTCLRQEFPVYADIPSHVKMSNNYIKCLLQNFFKSQFSNKVFLVDNKCFITADLLSDIANDAVSYWKYINNTDITAINIEDINNDFWNINIIERSANNWCTFTINSRRSVLKDFDLHPNCVYSNICSSNKQELNRSTSEPTALHLVTVFDIKNTGQQSIILKNGGTGSKSVKR